MNFQCWQPSIVNSRVGNIVWIPVLLFSTSPLLKFKNFEKKVKQAEKKFSLKLFRISGREAIMILMTGSNLKGL